MTDSVSEAETLTDVEVPTDLLVAPAAVNKEVVSGRVTLTETEVAGTEEE